MTGTGRTPLRVVGRYALYNEIAAGGMATIHLGRLLGPVGFARTVAVKRLHPQFAKDPEFVSMFLDEARLAARVQHPNVVATIDVVASEGELFLIMDYVRGESLSKILRTIRKQNSLVPPRIASSIICGFLHGLHSAHEAKSERGEPLGLVHRDVSPQNVLVGSDGIARVLDFGIAKAQGRIQVTRDGQIKGKLAYMPPEQLSGRDLSRAVDIYASAVVMWEMLTNERLFKGANERDTLSKILRDPVLPPSAIIPSLAPFDDVLSKALSRDPAQRHATAKELALDLERCCGVASTTSVGEWVEDAVGALLNAREEQIAQIESSSVGMTAPDLQGESDSDVTSLPSLEAIRQMMETGITPRPGRLSLSPSSGGVDVATPTHAMTPFAPQSGALDDGGTNPRTGTTTRTLTLPLQWRVPVVASIAGVAILMIAIAVVLGGSYSKAADTSRPNAPRGASSNSSGPRAATTDLVGAPLASGAAPDAPRASGDLAGEDAGSAKREDDAPTSTQPKPVAAAPPHFVARPTPSATQAAPPVPPPPAKMNCDPPFTIDPSGRKKYKRECM